MRLALATVLCAAASTPALAAVTGDVRLDAFVEACLDGHRDPVVRAGVIARAGWTEVADDDDPELAALMKEAREGMEQAREEDNFTGAAQVYGRASEGQSLYLVTTELYMDRSNEGEAKDADESDGEAWVIDFLACHLYDFAATEPLDPALVTAYFKEEPAKALDQSGVLVSQTWNVDSIAGVWGVDNTFIPEESMVSVFTGFTGVMLKITSTIE